MSKNTNTTTLTVLINEDAQLVIKLEIEGITIDPLVFRYSRIDTMSLVNQVLTKHGLPPVGLMTTTARVATPEILAELAARKESP